MSFFLASKGLACGRRMRNERQNGTLCVSILFSLMSQDCLDNARAIDIAIEIGEGEKRERVGQQKNRIAHSHDDESAAALVTPRGRERERRCRSGARRRRHSRVDCPGDHLACGDRTEGEREREREAEKNYEKKAEFFRREIFALNALFCSRTLPSTLFMFIFLRSKHRFQCLLLRQTDPQRRPLLPPSALLPREGLRPPRLPPLPLPLLRRRRGARWRSRRRPRPSPPPPGLPSRTPSPFPRLRISSRPLSGNSFRTPRGGTLTLGSATGQCSWLGPGSGGLLRLLRLRLLLLPVALRRTRERKKGRKSENLGFLVSPPLSVLVMYYN